MYGINPRIFSIEAVALLSDEGPYHRLPRMFNDSSVPVVTAAKSLEPRKSTRKENKFDVGDEMLVEHTSCFQ